MGVKVLIVLKPSCAGQHIQQSQMRRLRFWQLAVQGTRKFGKIANYKRLYSFCHHILAMARGVLLVTIGRIGHENRVRDDRFSRE